MSSNTFIHRFFLIAALLLTSCSKPLVAELTKEDFSYEEIIRLNNCGNQAESTQNVTHSFSTKIVGSGSINPGSDIVLVESTVSAAYEQYNSISKTQTVSAAPNTNMIFTLSWSEDIRSGNVTVNGQTINYTVHIPISVDQISSQNLGCEAGGTINSISTNLPQSTPESTQLGKVLFSDNFENGSADKFRNIVGLWKVIKDETGNWVYEINTLGKDEWAHSMFGQSSWSNYAIEYKIRILSFSASPDIGAQIGFKSAASDNLWHAYYSVQLVPSNQGLWLGYGDDTLNKYRMLASTDFHVEASTWYKVRIEIVGTSIKVFINDKENLNAYDSELTTGSLGFRVGPDMQVQYDDILITEITP